jgi:hypothetical protein
MNDMASVDPEASAAIWRSVDEALALPRLRPGLIDLEHQ